MTDDLPAFIDERIRAHRFLYATEDELQGALTEVLEGAGLHVEREVALSPSERVDLVVDGRVAVEVKVSGSATVVARQLQRYARHDQVEQLMLVTAVARHTRLPDRLGNKPLTVVPLMMGAL